MQRPSVRIGPISAGIRRVAQAISLQPIDGHQRIVDEVGMVVEYERPVQAGCVDGQHAYAKEKEQKNAGQTAVTDQHR
jgi:hypothetical protein